MKDGIHIRRLLTYILYIVLAALIGMLIWHFRDRAAGWKELYLAEMDEDEIDFAYWQGIYQDENIFGAVFIEKSNLSDFTNPNTIIYGHHMTDGSMFGELTKFEEPEFFEGHQEFAVYLPYETRTYEIVAAYRYPAEEQTAEYCRQVPEFVASYGGYARDGMELRAPVVTLSTCTSDNRSFRFLVQGWLADVKSWKDK